MGYTFNGYRRPDGQVGIRNYVGIIPSVTCASDVASAICRQVPGLCHISASSGLLPDAAGS